jgi:cell division septation protein DedD
MATTAHDDGFHEIQLNGKQLVFLFMAVTVVSVVIFLCGVLVGRGVRVQRGDADPVAATEASAPAPEIPPIASAPAGGPPATANEELSYPERLAGTQPPTEKLRSTPPARASAAPVDTPVPAVASPAAAVEAATPAEPAGSGFAIQLAALREREEADGIVRRLTGKGYPAYVVAPAAGAPSVFRVRVGKFNDRREAESVAARLQKEEQFNPWIVR